MASTNIFASELVALIDCLESEYRALLAQDIGQLSAVLAHKRQLLARLAAQPAASGTPHGNDRQASVHVRRALTRLREMNRRNALVLGPRSAVIGARLRFLQAAIGRNPVYAADGSLAPGVFRAAYPHSA